MALMEKIFDWLFDSLAKLVSNYYWDVKIKTSNRLVFLSLQKWFIPLRKWTGHLICPTDLCICYPSHSALISITELGSFPHLPTADICLAYYRIAFISNKYNHYINFHVSPLSMLTKKRRKNNKPTTISENSKCNQTHWER